jgi:hypothetical protein
MLKTTLAGFVVVGLLLLSSPEAQAGSPVNCGPNESWDGQKCQIIVTTSPGGSGGGQAVAGGSGGSSSPRTCLYAGISMPCQDPALGWWSDSRYCYVKLTSPQPPASVAAWGGHTNGAVYDCALPQQGSFGGLQYLFWSATAPAGPDPLVLAQTAIASMNLRPISIGIVPEDKPGSVGLVGMPVWLWASNPDQQSWGPITRSASAGGVTVTATATVDRVRWQMGDGAVVMCAGPGTVYEDRFGKTKSPTCGYLYTRQGTYTVRAESQWVVSWSGMGLSGTIPVTLNQATTITVGELQVITTG